MDPAHARRILTTLRSSLALMVTKDQEQEVQGIALPVIDEALVATKGLLADSPVLARIRDVISPEAIEAGDPVRAIDVLMVVDLMLAELPPEPRQRSQVWSPDLRTTQW